MTDLKSFDNEFLEEGEAHPTSLPAEEFINSIPIGVLQKLLIELEEKAKEGNKIAQVNTFALKKFINKDKLTDRYIMGLAWTLLTMITEIEQNRSKNNKKNE